MFMFSRKQTMQPAGPKGRRAYVVGDVHGRLDLLDLLLDKIDSDIHERGPRETLLVFVGDLIDRGPNSAQVVERLRTYRRAGVRPVFLLGNHEEVLLRLLDGDASLIPGWLRFGGAQCLESYGADPAQLRSMSDSDAITAIRQAISKEHVAFLKGFADTCRFGDYLFVHAGIRPGVSLDDQRQSDLRWIRDPFLLDDTDHGFVVVHGHTIRSRVEERSNRIGIDTGAYSSGILTALAIEDGRRWYVDTRMPADPAVSPAH
jgi:serine/threonine protein phosphatase 1